MLSPEPKILIVDDDPAILQVVSSTLRRLGYNSLYSASGIESALHLWSERNGNFDLLLTDFSLPDGATPEFIAALLKEKSDLKVLLMTGYSSYSVDLGGSLNERVMLLEKPFSPTELRDILHAQLSSRN